MHGAGSLSAHSTTWFGEPILTLGGRYFDDVIFRCCIVEERHVRGKQA
jgi:hypothetical protein